jgi:hypothetical protein
MKQYQREESKGGQVAKNARIELEEQTGNKVVSGKSFLAKRVK